MAYMILSEEEKEWECHLLCFLTSSAHPSGNPHSLIHSAIESGEKKFVGILPMAFCPPETLDCSRAKFLPF
jgi:hypothetical protein